MKKTLIALSSLVLALLLMFGFANKKVSALEPQESYSSTYHVGDNARAATVTSNFDAVVVNPLVHDNANPNNFIGLNVVLSEGKELSSYTGIMVRVHNMGTQKQNTRCAVNHEEGTNGFSMVSTKTDPAYKMSGNTISAATLDSNGGIEISAKYDGYIIYLFNNATKAKTANSFTFYASINNFASWYKTAFGTVSLIKMNDEKTEITEKVDVWDVNFDTPNYSAAFWDWVNTNHDAINERVMIKAVHANQFLGTTAETSSDSNYSYAFPAQMQADLTADSKVDMSAVKGVALDIANTNNNTNVTFRITQGGNFNTNGDSTALFIPNTGDPFWGAANVIPANFEGMMFLAYNNTVFANGTAAMPMQIDTANAKLILQFNSPYNADLYINNVTWLLKDPTQLARLTFEKDDNSTVTLKNGVVNGSSAMYIAGSTPQFVIAPKEGYKLSSVKLGESSVLDQLVDNKDGTYSYNPTSYNGELLKVETEILAFDLSLHIEGNETLPENAQTTFRIILNNSYTLPVPTKANATFVGWCDEHNHLITGSNGESLANYEYTRDITVHALWDITDDYIDLNMNSISTGARSTVLSSSFDGISLSPQLHVQSTDNNMFGGVNLILGENNKAAFNAVRIRIKGTGNGALNVRVAYNHAEGTNGFSICYTGGQSVYLEDLSGNFTSLTTASNGSMTLNKNFDGYIILPFASAAAFANLTSLQSLTVYSTLSNSQNWWKYVVGDAFYVNFNNEAETKLTDVTRIFTVDFEKPNYTQCAWNWAPDANHLDAYEQMDCRPIHRHEFIGTNLDPNTSAYYYNFSSEFITAHTVKNEEDADVLDMSGVKGFMLYVRSTASTPLVFNITLNGLKTIGADSALFIPETGTPFWEDISKGIPGGFVGKVYLPYELHSFTGSAAEIPQQIALDQAKLAFLFSACNGARVVIDRMAIVMKNENSNSMFMTVNINKTAHGTIVGEGVAHGIALSGDLKFKVEADLGYEIESVTVNEVEVQLNEQGEYTIANYAGQEISATFKFSERNIDINLDADGGTIESNTVQIISARDFTLPVPTKEGYRFLGWFDSYNNKITDLKGNSLEKFMHMDSVTYYAHYEPISDDYALDSPKLQESASGVYYSSFDGIQVQTIMTSNYNLFEGVTFSGLNDLDWAQYNCIIVEFEQITSRKINFRLAYNHVDGTNSFGRFDDNTPMYLYKDGVLTLLSEPINKDNVAQMAHDFTGAVSGYLVCPIKYVDGIETITIYGSVNGKQNGSIFNIGKIYLGKFVDAIGGGDLPKLNGMDLLWEPNHETPNYDGTFWNWLEEGTEGADITKEQTFRIVPVQKGGYTINQEIVDQVTYSYGVTEVIMNELGGTDESTLNMNLVQGLKIKVKNNTNKAVPIDVLLTSANDTWRALKGIIATADSKEKTTIVIPANFDGVIVIPYLDAFWYDINYTKKQIPETLIVNNSFSISFLENEETGSIIVSEFALSKDVSEYVGVVNYRSGQNGEIHLVDNEDGVVSYGSTVTFEVTPQAGYEVDSVKLSGQTVTLTNNRYEASNYQGEEFTVTFKPATFTITLDLQGGELSKTSVTVEYLEGASLGTPAKEGYIFVGWAESANGEPITGDNGKIQSYTFTSDKTLYAVYEKAGGNIDDDQPGKTTTKTPDTPTEPSQTGKKKGCKGEIATSILGISIVLGSVVIIRRRKEKDI